MDVDKKANVSFGTTLNREMFPTKVPPTRFGNDLSPMRGAPHRGPGCYDNEEVSNFMYQIKHKLTSEKGYTLGARTAPRFRQQYTIVAPAPDRYQTEWSEPKTFEPSYKPFNVSADRFQVYKRDLDEVSPGAGTYEHEIARNRKVDWHQSFGGGPINLPSVKQHSTIDQNTEKLLSTKEEKKYHRRLAYLKLYY